LVAPPYKGTSQLGEFNIETVDSDCKVWAYATTNGRARRRRSAFAGFGMIPQDDREQRESNEDANYIPGIDSHRALGAMAHRPDIHGCGDDTDDQICKQKWIHGVGKSLARSKLIRRHTKPTMVPARKAEGEITLVVCGIT
jgi:hypothetical protein